MEAPSRFESLQRLCLFVSGLAVAHFVIGLALWVYLIYCTMVPIVRNYPADVATDEILKWAVQFGIRIWKCILPLAVAIVSLHQNKRRPRISMACLSAVICFSIIMSYSDISANRWDLATFDWKSGSGEHYMTWWWYHE
jgi:hypothetical protein